MTFHSHTAPYYTEWLVRILFGIGSIVVTSIGCWITNIPRFGRRLIGIGMDP